MSGNSPDILNATALICAASSAERSTVLDCWSVCLVSLAFVCYVTGVADMKVMLYLCPVTVREGLQSLMSYSGRKDAYCSKPIPVPGYETMTL